MEHKKNTSDVLVMLKQKLKACNRLVNILPAAATSAGTPAGLWLQNSPRPVPPHPDPNPEQQETDVPTCVEEEVRFWCNESILQHGEQAENNKSMTTVQSEPNVASPFRTAVQDDVTVFIFLSIFRVLRECVALEITADRCKSRTNQRNDSPRHEFSVSLCLLTSLGLLLWMPTLTSELGIKVCRACTYFIMFVCFRRYSEALKQTPVQTSAGNSNSFHACGAETHEYS